MDAESFTDCIARNKSAIFTIKKVIFVSKKKKKPEKTEKFYMVSDKKIEEIKKNARNEGISEAFVLMLGLSVMTISDHFRELWEVKGHDKCREERFTDYVLKLWEEYQAGIFSLQDVLDCLKDECGLTIELDKTERII